MRTRNYIYFLFSMLFSVSGFCQMIDSVEINPYPNVDSIEYWHHYENINGKTYLTYGYFQYCNCHIDLYPDDFPATSKNKRIISEGFIENNIKNGKWEFWNNVKSECCQGYNRWTDSTVFYKDGVRIDKRDFNAHYIFFEDQIKVELFHKKVYNFGIECRKDSCEILLEDKYLVKKFNKMDLATEIYLIGFGDYNSKAKSILNDIRNKEDKK